ncbi:MAG: glutamate--tRNA ligase [Candidatus Babeliales bacterium]
MNSSVRVRFAPSPTGLIHLGSVRTALFNYLFARKEHGTLILRIEDTDHERNFDPQAVKILEDLAWLQLPFDEGPTTGGPYKPYFQSQRMSLYQEKLEELITKKAVYRCFCSEEELEQKRLRQMALKQPPRYDRTCTQLSSAAIEEKVQHNTPFIWRFKLDTQKVVHINDIARGTIEFDLAHFSDFAVTRQNGTFTFLFANAVDDVLMKISHIFRGEDHISNTPLQVALYASFNFNTPIFWHMPTICNIDGKKLSKRDFGFSLRDLKEGGFLPEAICNYLAIIGASFKQEIMALEELVHAIDFTKINSTSGIKYDLEKLLWVNHQWIMRSSTERIARCLQPFIHAAYPASTSLNDETYLQLIDVIRPELRTLKDAVPLLQFYFTYTPPSSEQLTADSTTQAVLALCKTVIAHATSTQELFDVLKKESVAHGIGQKQLWQNVRLLLTGSTQGLSVKDTFELLGLATIKQRIERL